ncbi:protein NRT1/ PTR FAMILY 5.5-like [Salvia divinorum]|uniref:Protein NRT1/ PTR FAMILY 5.5-like n=1 Tax=Salvia divinorum TaxID=28513 RepID=A0ABD1GN95_SALDI
MRLEDKDGKAGRALRRYFDVAVDFVSGLGFFSSVLSVYVVGKLSHWFQYTLNRSRLDRYYWLLAGLSAVNLVVFNVVALGYMRKKTSSTTSIQRHCCAHQRVSFPPPLVRRPFGAAAACRGVRAAAPFGAASRSEQACLCGCLRGTAASRWQQSYRGVEGSGSPSAEEKNLRKAKSLITLHVRI